ncbi:hypothetical protein DFH28DRAFT_1122116 [Melampsora americana]|nr:hypothetical protein DFH28DRAFT_1122116 [Melampsora americana]
MPRMISTSLNQRKVDHRFQEDESTPGGVAVAGHRSSESTQWNRTSFGGCARFGAAVARWLNEDRPSVGSPVEWPYGHRALHARLIPLGIGKGNE